MRLKRAICLLVLACLVVVGLPGFEQTAQAAARYYITVDLTNQIVTVYDNGNVSDSGITRQMICSTGKAATPTPTGVYTLPAKWKSSERTEWYYFPEYSCYAKWATRIVGGILFHSVLYTAAKVGPTKSSTNALGSKASHGCVRLRVADAQWIAQNCPAGTKCRIYSSGKTDTALRKKLLSKSFSRASETYDHYMGRVSNDPAQGDGLAKGSAGDYVTMMQWRLMALGFQNDIVDGKFGANTETAVKRFQAAAGLAQTGKVNLDVWVRMFAADAPTGTFVTWTPGMEGPAVVPLQQALSDLTLYRGEINGRYDALTSEAVRLYQGYFGFPVTGNADAALQRDAIARAASVKAQFGGSPFVLTASSEPVAMARVTAKNYAALRSKSSTSASTLAKLPSKTEVEVLSKGSSWARVRYGSQTGYVLNKYLAFFTGSRTTVSYETVFIPTPEPTPEPTPWIFIPVQTPAADPEPVATTGWEWLSQPAAATVVTEDGEIVVLLGEEPVAAPTPEPPAEDAPALEMGVEPTPEPSPEPAEALVIESEE